jgi:predicted nuclease of predicted toxin-antitoxin system
VRKRFDIAFIAPTRDSVALLVHFSRIIQARASDAAIMAWARDGGYVVFTHDLDFSALLAATEAPDRA